LVGQWANNIIYVPITIFSFASRDEMIKVDTALVDTKAGILADRKVFIKNESDKYR
jgi:hypothetical protein